MTKQEMKAIMKHPYLQMTLRKILEPWKSWTMHVHTRIHDYTKLFV